ncbi:hypothetical protein RB195_014609 [Necator americanus]|uniref:Uncharacterized protein n=1 Tax=Necator americanus TaxID=51031 RepID=A0ABR1E194_NECAM
MDEMENGNRRTVRQESPCSTEVEALQGGCASCCPLRMRVLADDESLGKSVARYGDADVEVDGGITLTEKVSNDTVRSIFGVVPITEKIKEARLKWFGPKIRWLDRVNLDVIDARLGTADAMDGSKWKTRSRKADPTTTWDKR